ncbi:hypothetical protein QPK87_23540 [Kamptonema cortianum]|nr:hypothetical protein [Kamptonema cortianum]
MIMLKKGVSYLVLSSFLLMDSASCMEPEEKSPSSPRRSPRILIDTSESSVNPAPSSSSPSDLLSLDFQERLQAIFTLPWHERNRLYAELALKEDIPLALRRVALLYIDSMESLDEPTKERLENLIIAFLSNEKLINHQEILKMISWLAENDRNRLYTKLALQEDIPMVLRQEAFSSIYSTDSLGETTREGLKSLRTTFLNSEDLSFKGRFAFLPNLGEEAPLIVTLLSLSRALESADNESYSEWDIYRLTSFLMSYDRTESQEGIETCFFKQPILFLDGSTYEEWLRTTLETGDERKRTSILQKLRELLHSSEDAKKVAAAIKFILQYSQDAGDKETALETFFNIAAQQTASHSEIPREQLLRGKLDISEACKALLPHVPEDKATLLRILSEEMRQQVGMDVSAIVDPQERLQTISTLPWDEEGQKLRYKLLAELTLQEGIPMALRRETFSSIHSTDSLGEATREGLKSLRTTFLNDENLLFKDRFAFLPNLGEEAPPIATLSSLSRALESADNESYSEWDIYRLTSFLMNYDRTESQEGIETCFFQTTNFISRWKHLRRMASYYP